MRTAINCKIQPRGVGSSSFWYERRENRGESTEGRVRENGGEEEEAKEGRESKREWRRRWLVNALSCRLLQNLFSLPSLFTLPLVPM